MVADIFTDFTPFYWFTQEEFYKMYPKNSVSKGKRKLYTENKDS